VKDNFQLPAVRLLEELVEISHGAKSFIYPPIVRDIIAKVGHGRGEYRRNPNCMGTQPLQVIQFLDNSPQVADTDIVGVHKCTGVDLVNDTGYPPRGVCRCDHNNLSCVNISIPVPEYPDIYVSAVNTNTLTGGKSSAQELAIV